LSILRNDDFVVAGSNDAELRTWKISKMNDEESEIKMSELLSSDNLLDFAVSIFFSSIIIATKNKKIMNSIIFSHQ